MPQPFDYSLNVPNPAQAVLQGVQLAQGIGQAKTAQAEAKAAEAKAARTAAFNADVAKIAGAPTAAGYASLIARYPELSSVLKEGFDVLSKEEQNERIRQGTAVYSALSAGENEFAKETLTKQAEAYRAAGREQDAKQLDDLAKLVELSPETAQTTAGLYLATNMGADKFVEGFSKLEAERRTTALEESTLTKADAEAATAATKAKFADSEAALELQKKGWDIAKIQNDIQVAKQNTRIAAMQAALSKETNEQRKQLLESKLTDAQVKRDETVRERVANADSARASIDNFLNTADRALKTPYEVIENATGAIDAALPTLRNSTADFEGLVETMTSQAFLAQVPNLKGTGSLSNAEGEKLQAALQNLKLRQSPERLINNIKEAQRLLLKARANITARFGVPETVPDTPDAEPSRSELENLLDLYGG